MTGRDHLTVLAAMVRMPSVWIGCALGGGTGLVVHWWLKPVLHGWAYWAALVTATAAFGLGYGLAAGWFRSRRNRVTSSQSAGSEQGK